MGRSTIGEARLRTRRMGHARTTVGMARRFWWWRSQCRGGPNQASGQAKPGAKKLDLAHVTPPPSRAGDFKWMCEELTKRSGGSLNAVFQRRTLLTKGARDLDAVKSGNIAMGSPAGAACTVFPEMCVFLTPFLVRDYHHAYAMFNGEIGKNLDETFPEEVQAEDSSFFYDYGFRHFWNNAGPSIPGRPEGAEMRVPGVGPRVRDDTVNGLGASRGADDPLGPRMHPAAHRESTAPICRGQHQALKAYEVECRRTTHCGPCWTRIFSPFRSAGV